MIIKKKTKGKNKSVFTGKDATKAFSLMPSVGTLANCDKAFSVEKVSF